MTSRTISQIEADKFDCRLHQLGRELDRLYGYEAWQHIQAARQVVRRQMHPDDAATTEWEQTRV